MLSTMFYPKPVLILRKDILKKCRNLFTSTPLNFFSQIGLNTDWAILVFVRSIPFFVDKSNVCHFQTTGKLTNL